MGDDVEELNKPNKTKPNATAEADFGEAAPLEADPVLEEAYGHPEGDAEEGVAAEDDLPLEVESDDPGEHIKCLLGDLDVRMEKVFSNNC